jgi:teichuronic acid exporter
LNQKASLNSKILGGMLWSSLEKFSVQGVSFVIGIILARLLTPREYGTVGLLLVFISFSQVFIDSGFGAALIQKQDRSENDINTVFTFNFLVAILCFIIIWLIAPFISAYYDIEELTKFVRLLSITLFFQAVGLIPQTLLTIDMNFKSLAKVNIIATLLSGIIAIYLAYNDYGEMAIIWQTILKTLFIAIIIWFFVKWRPNFKFFKNSFDSLFSFGSKLLISSLLNNIVNNITSLFIGKYLSVKSLGYYTRGSQFSDMIFGSIYSIYNSVLLPSLSSIQNNKILLVSQTRNIIKISSVLIFPFFIFLAVNSKPIIILLLTEKWLEAAPIMGIICIARAITIISGVNINLLYAIGRSDLVLKQQYFKLSIRIIFLLISLKFGIIWIAIAELLATIAHFFINTYYPGKIMEYGALKQINDSKGPIIISTVLALISLMLFTIIKNDILKISLSLILFTIIYYAISKLFGNNEIDKLSKKIKQAIWKK